MTTLPVQTTRHWRTPTRNPARTALAGLCAAAMLALQACGSMQPAGDGAGASNGAASTLNTLRAEHGLPALVPDRQLEQAALQQARFMAAAGRMTHTTGWGKDFASRVKDNRITGAAAENIAAGRMDTARVLETWKNSPPHRRNMLDARFTRFGLAYVYDAKNRDWRYWAMVLGK